MIYPYRFGFLSGAQSFNQLMFGDNLEKHKELASFGGLWYETGMNTYSYPCEGAVGVAFSDIVVRLIHAGERDDWDSLMSVHHYLGLHSLVGESLRYVAEVPERWLALLGVVHGGVQMPAA